MKLEDIKKSLSHAAEVELQRALYNAAGILEVSEIQKILHATMNDIYDSESFGAVAGS